MADGGVPTETGGPSVSVAEARVDTGPAQSADNAAGAGASHAEGIRASILSNELASKPAGQVMEGLANSAPPNTEHISLDAELQNLNDGKLPNAPAESLTEADALKFSNELNSSDNLVGQLPQESAIQHGAQGSKENTTTQFVTERGTTVTVNGAPQAEAGSQVTHQAEQSTVAPAEGTATTPQVAEDAVRGDLQPLQADTDQSPRVDARAPDGSYDISGSSTRGPDFSATIDRDAQGGESTPAADADLAKKPEGPASEAADGNGAEKPSNPDAQPDKQADAKAEADGTAKDATKDSTENFADKAESPEARSQQIEDAVRIGAELQGMGVDPNSEIAKDVLACVKENPELIGEYRKEIQNAKDTAEAMAKVAEAKGIPVDEKELAKLALKGIFEKKTAELDVSEENVTDSENKAETGKKDNKKDDSELLDAWTSNSEAAKTKEAIAVAAKEKQSKILRFLKALLFALGVTAMTLPAAATSIGMNAFAKSYNKN